MTDPSQKLEGGELSMMPPENSDGELPRFERGDESERVETPEGLEASNENDVPRFDEPEEMPDRKSSQDAADIRNNDLDGKDGVDKAEIDELKDEYIDELLDYSDCPETIDEDKFREAELEKVEPEENGKKREEFNEKKDDLIKEWEQKNGREWPRYEEDVYSDSGKLIRKEGQRYDAHHIQPLGMGGQNTADNLTPLHAQDHYDKQGIHSPDGAYSKLEAKLDQKG